MLRGTKYSGGEKVAKITPKKESTKIQNHVGAVAFKQTPKEELVFAILTSFLDESYYEGTTERTNRISDLAAVVAGTDPLFVAKAAVYARKVFNMRSAPQFLLAQLAKLTAGTNMARVAMRNFVTRVDDMTEIAGYFLSTTEKIPSQIRKGICDVLTDTKILKDGTQVDRIDTYQLAKYKNETGYLSLVDLFNLVHPNPSTETQKANFKALMTGQLKNTETWEARLSSGEDKGKVFKEMIITKKLPYMALLRNLRNIVNYVDEEGINAALARIVDPEEVKQSKQLPFRFLSAMTALEGTDDAAMEVEDKFVFEHDVKNQKDKSAALQRAIKAVETAVMLSMQNIPILEGKTAIFSDNSGSMQGDGGGISKLSTKSARKTSDIANLFATMYWMRADNTLVGLFGDRLLIPELDRTATLFTNYKTIAKTASSCGGATEAGLFAAFRKLIDNKETPDRIVIFSDQQVGENAGWYGRDVKGEYSGDFNKLLQQFKQQSPKTIIYSIDLRGYGNKLCSDNVVLLAGFSDKLFELMYRYEKQASLLTEIDKVYLK
jgi:hypothetical protein